MPLVSRKITTNNPSPTTVTTNTTPPTTTTTTTTATQPSSNQSNLKPSPSSSSSSSSSSAHPSNQQSNQFNSTSNSHSSEPTATPPQTPLILDQIYPQTLESSSGSNYQEPLHHSFNLKEINQLYQPVPKLSPIIQATTSSALAVPVTLIHRQSSTSTHHRPDFFKRHLNPSSSSSNQSTSSSLNNSSSSQNQSNNSLEISHSSKHPNSQLQAGIHHPLGLIRSSKLNHHLSQSSAVPNSTPARHLATSLTTRSYPQALLPPLPSSLQTLKQQLHLTVDALLALPQRKQYHELLHKSFKLIKLHFSGESQQFHLTTQTTGRHLIDFQRSSLPSTPSSSPSSPPAQFKL
ncbi:hypothetical protein BY996DRAFT_6488264 [Phakopsora pachyrhizi]|nr:hypothetical protein BY996DRAFT_6488264 [Phakopsora pachyrhizi]